MQLQQVYVNFSSVQFQQKMWETTWPLTASNVLSRD
jgi:hypothetical protein